ncbi:hypothetical protein Neosp_010239 [[Neocosmospora] mangrovei]
MEASAADKTSYTLVSGREQLETEARPPTPAVPRSTKNSVHTETPHELSQKPTRQVSIRSWLWESLALFLALGFLAAIVAIPASYDGSTTRHWPFSINLNTVVAILATFMRAAMLLIMAEVLGQVKWQALHQPRPLSDIYHFDYASRSIIGSIKLLWAVPPQIVSIVAALVMIVSPAVGPFTQQAIKTVPCLQTRPGAQASLPVSHYVPADDTIYRPSPAGFQITGDMRAAMINGLVSLTGNETAISATCETGNCTFPSTSSGVTHSTIAMCSACLDTSDFISWNKTSSNFNLPNGQWVSFNPSSPLSAYTGDVDWARSKFTPKFATSSEQAMTNITVLTMTQATCLITEPKFNKRTCAVNKLTPDIPSGHQGTDIIALSCAIYPCLKQFHGAVEQGAFKERLVKEEPVYYNRSGEEGDVFVEGGVNFYINRTGIQEPCLVADVEYSLANFSRSHHPSTTGTSPLKIDGVNYTVPNECVYKFRTDYSMALESFMDRTLFNGNCTTTSYSGTFLDCGDKWWLASMYNTTVQSLDLVFDQFTTAMTNNFRTRGSKGPFVDGKDEIAGTATEMAICTLFDWRWVLLPIALISISAGLLVSAIVQSYTSPSIPVWKTSILPLLFHGPIRTTGQPETATRLNELYKQAKNVVVKFDEADTSKLKEVEAR